MRTSPSRLINDIRCFEAARDPRNGLTIEPSNQVIFNTDLHVRHISERLFWKLRESSFKLNGFSEIHMQFVPGDKYEVLKIYNDGIYKWKRDVYFLYDHIEWVSANLKEQEALLIKSIATACLEFKDIEQASRVKHIEKELLNRGEDLPVTIYTKEVKNYRADVRCYIPSRKEAITCWVEYQDKKTNKTYKRDFLTLTRVSDISLICGNIVVKSGDIVISPKTGLMAQLVADDYDTPFVIALRDMALM